MNCYKVLRPSVEQFSGKRAECNVTSMLNFNNNVKHHLRDL